MSPVKLSICVFYSKAKKTNKHYVALSCLKQFQKLEEKMERVILIKKVLQSVQLQFHSKILADARRVAE